MAEAPQQQFVDIDPDFEPLSRPRSCTWPLPRPEFLDPSGSSTSSPAASVKHEPGGHSDYVNSLSLLEESEDYREQKPVTLCGDFGCQEECVHQQQQQQHHHQHHHQQQQQHHHSPQVPQQQQQTHAAALPSPVGSSSSVSAAAAAAQRKSSSSRRNAWGNMSYADLITKAIDSSPEKRLTLSQIYDWMVKSVPYFKDKGDSNSSAGWKNSIRHNLSLHSRFVRVQNEGTGKSSWWMLNPEGGKSGKSPRRRAASMDNNSKFTRSRGRAAKKKVSHQGSEGGADSPGSQFSKWPGSPNSHSNDDFEVWNTFRPRTSSNASTVSGRLSPFLTEQEDLGDGDVHLVYPPGPAAKMSSTLPSLSEVTSSLDHHGSENVMESLLDNLNLVSPKASQVGGTGGGASSGSAQSSPSSMMQANSTYPTYNSPSMVPQPPQDYCKRLYDQTGVSALPPMNLQTLPETKPGYGSYLGQYCPAGLLKELLTSDADPHSELMPSVETVVTQSAGGCLPPPYGSQTQQGPGGKMLSPHPHPHSHPHQHPHQHAVHGQAPPTTVALNGRALHPLISMSHTSAPSRLAAIKQHVQLPQGQHLHLGGTSSLLPGYCSVSTNGYSRSGPPQPYPHEKLPSDLDGMSVERFECDMESVLHDALMDGDSLDFNFEPMVTQQGFIHGVKTTTHSWVSG